MAPSDTPRQAENAVVPPSAKKRLQLAGLLLASSIPVFRHCFKDHRTGFRPFEVTPNAWADGRWDYLRGREEGARFAVIANFIKHYAPSGSVLDVACGEGVLLDHLRQGDVVRYVGVDIDEVAVRRARARVDPSVDIVLADAQRYVPEENFDVIIYNECLYYFSQPLDLMLQHAGSLNRDGVILCSTFITPRTLPLMGEVERVFSLLDDVHVSVRKGLAWRVAAFSPIPLSASGSAVRPKS